MKLYEFALLGKQLRDAQKAYDDSRTQSAWVEARRLGRLFDAACLQIIGDYQSLIACQQMGLFEEARSEKE